MTIRILPLLSAYLKSLNSDMVALTMNQSANAIPGMKINAIANKTNQSLFSFVMSSLSIAIFY
ncbi:hypothetical protein [Clostridium sp.]|uniref:hypothetical protein n=1 Tax=Clostridium sp. TaxID=1506 RepID=UPI003FD76C43